MDDSIFRQKGPDQFPRGIDNQAVDANPSELSGSTSVQRPVWEKFVTNTVAQENNQAAVRAENDQIRSAMRMGETWKGADGKLLRKVGRQSEMLDAEAFTDHPVAGPEARKSLWDREVRTWRKDAQDAAFALRDPSFHSGAMTDKEREDALNEGAMLPETDPRHVELKSKLRADDDYRARKAELAQRSFDSEKRARELESTDPESWWSSRSQPKPSEQRAAVVADAQARAGEADAAADSATQELAGIDAKLAQGVRGSEVDALKARRAEIATGQAVAAQEKAKAAEQVRGVQEQAKADSSDFMRGAEVSLRQIPQLAYGVAGLIGDTMEKTLGVGSSLRDWGLKGYADAEQKAAPLQRDHDDVTKAWAKAKSGDVGALVDWAQYGLGYAFGQLGETLAVSAIGGVAGAAAGTAAEPGGGTAVGGAGGALAGVVAKGATKSLAKGLIEKAIASQATKLAAKELAKDGVEATAEAITKRAADAAIRKAAAKEIGSNIAVMGNALGMEIGSIYPEAVKQAQAEGRELTGTDLARVWGTGIAAGGIEGLTDKLGIDLLKGKFADALPGGRIAGAAVGGLADAGVEAGTEAVQTGIERLGARQSLTDSEAQSDYINSAAMGAIGGAAVGGIGGAMEHGGNTPGAEHERVATELAALDPEAEPPSPDEIALGVMIAPRSPAEGVLVERELAQVEAEDDQAAADAAANVEAVKATGDAKATKAAEEGIAKIKPRAPLVRAVLKIAGGMQADDLTDTERNAVGIAKSDSGEFSAMDDKELADAGIPGRMIDVGADGSIILTDGALKKVGEISPRARGLVKMTEAEAIQKAKERAAQQLSTDTQNGAQGDPAAGVFQPSEEGSVVPPHETNAAVGNSQNKVDDASHRESLQMSPEERMDDEKRIQRKLMEASLETDDKDEQFRRAGYQNVDGFWIHPHVDPAWISGLKPETKARLKDGGIEFFDPEHESSGRMISFNDGTRGMGVRTNADIGHELYDDKDITVLHELGHHVWQNDLTEQQRKDFSSGGIRTQHGREVASGKGRGETYNSSIAGGVNSVAEEDFAQHYAENGGDLERTLKPATPNLVETSSKSGDAHKRARARFSRVKRRLKDRIIEGKERSITRPEGITINPKQIINEALANGMTDEQAGDHFDRVLDEEIRHLAQYDAAKILYRAEKSTEPFLDWMETHYAAIWQSDFVATGKDTIIRDLYANSQAEWDAMSDGDKALEAIRMMSQGDAITEQGKLWADISEALKQAITAAIAALNQFRDIASPTIKSEITNLENALKQLNQSRPGDSKTGSQKPASSQKGDGTGGKAQTKRDSGTGGNGGIEPERRDGAGSPLVVGAKVEFTKNGKTRTGVVAIVQGGNVAVRPDDNPGIAVGVDVGDVRVIATPPTPSASTPEVENQTPTPKTPWPSPKEKEKAEKAKAASPADSTAAAGEQSPVALNPRAIRLHAAMAPGFGWTGNTGMEWARRLDEMISAKESGGRFQTMQFLSNWNNGLNLPLVKALFKEVGIPPVKGWTQKGIKEALENWASPTIEYTPEAATPTPTKEKSTLTEAEQALKDAFKGMVDGLEASRLGESYTQGIPPEKIPQFITAAQKLIADGVTSPKGLAAALDKISPKLRVYSEAVWSAFRMVDPSLPVGVDWAGVYGGIDKAIEKEQITPEEQPNDATQQSGSGGSVDPNGSKKPAGESAGQPDLSGVRGGAGSEEGGGTVPAGKPNGGRRGNGKRGPTPRSGGDAEGSTNQPGETGTDSGSSVPDGREAGDSDVRKLIRPPQDSPEANFVIADDFSLPSGPKARIEANLKAIRLLREIEREERNATSEEKAILAKYSGWGSFKNAFNQTNQTRWEKIKQRLDATGYNQRFYIENSSEYKELAAWRERWGELYDQLTELLEPDEFRAMSKSILNAHYTSLPIIDSMWKMVERLGFKGGKVLETSAGGGYFVGRQPKQLADQSEWSAVELDEITSRIFSKLYPESRINGESPKENRKVNGQGFQQSTIPNNSIDLVIGNFPFDDLGPNEATKEFGMKMNLHNYFFARSLDKVRPGGLVVSITSASTMDNNLMQRELLAGRAELVAAIRLPNTAFKDSAGTEVTTDIIILRKKDGSRDVGGEAWLHTVPVGTDVVTVKPSGKDSYEYLSSIPAGWVPVVKSLRESWAEWRAGRPRTGEKWKNIIQALKDSGFNAQDGIRFNAPIEVNQYFENHPEMVMGKHALAGTMYSAGEYAVIPDGQNLMERIEEAIANLPENVLGENVESELEKYTTIEAERGDREGSTIMRDGKVYQVIKRQLVPVRWDVDVLEDVIDGHAVMKGNKALRSQFNAASSEMSAEDLDKFLRKIMAEKMTKDEIAKIEKKIETEVAKRNAVFASWSKVRDTARELVNAELNDLSDEKTEGLREKLNEVYDAHVAKFGAFNKRGQNPHRFLDDDEDTPLLDSLEDEELVSTDAKGKPVYRYVKRPIFSKSQLSKTTAPESAESIEDAVGISIGYLGRLSVPYMAKLLNTSESEVSSMLNESGLALVNPKTGLYETADMYLSGEVRTKLREAEKANLESGGQYARNIELLKSVLPQNRPIQSISVNMGARWIPGEVYTKFAQEVLGLGEMSVSYQPAANLWRIEDGGTSRRIKSTTQSVTSEESFETDRVGVGEILDSILNKRQLAVYDTVGRGQRVFNSEATVEAKAKADQMAEKFNEWVKASDSVVEVEGEDIRVGELAERLYNENVAGVIPPSFKGDWVTLPGQSGEIWLKPHRKAVLARMLTLGYGMMAHGVGSGKTYNQIALAMELRRLGKARKVMTLVQNSTIKQFAASHMKAYPQSRILVADEKNFTARKRAKFQARIATGDYDSIILTHSNVALIGHDEQAIRNYMARAFDQLTAALADAEEGSTEQRDIQKAMDKLQEKLDKMLKEATSRAGGLLTWEQLGIDALIVDEAHAFKNAPIVTRMARVKNLPNGDGSAQAIMMQMKVANVQATTGGKNIFFATGTPITNTMAEAYTMLNFIAPTLLEQRGIKNFDDFATTFGRTVSEPEATWKGEIENVERFAKFINGPELVNLIRSVFDVALGNESMGIRVPRMKGGKPQAVLIEPTEASEIFNDWIIDTAAAFAAIPNKKKAFEADPWLSAIPIMTMQAGMAQAIDPRLINPNVPDDPDSKVNRVVDEVVRIYKQGEKNRTAQVIFSDLSNPFSTLLLRQFNGDPFEEYGSVSDEMESLEGAIMAFQGRKELTDSEEKEKKRLVKRYSDLVANQFNLFEDIKAKLIAKGIPASEIAIASSDMDRKKLQASFEKVNSGQIRIIMGSTARLGVGVNIQERLAGCHNLSPPRDFKPAMMEQRIGRIERQGNLHRDWADTAFIQVVEKFAKTTFEGKNLEERYKNAVKWLDENDNGRDVIIRDLAEKAAGEFDVDVINYGLKLSMDSAVYSMMNAKQGFIEQVLMGENVLDEFDDPASEEAAGFALMAAEAMGNEDLKTKVILDGEIRKLRAVRTGYLRDQWTRKSNLESTQSRIQKYLKKDPNAIREAGKEIEGVFQRVKRTIKTTKGSIAKAENREISDEEAKQPAERTEDAPVYRFGDEEIDMAKSDSKIIEPLNKFIVSLHAEAVDAGRTVERDIYVNDVRFVVSSTHAKDIDRATVRVSTPHKFPGGDSIYGYVSTYTGNPGNSLLHELRGITTPGYAERYASNIENQIAQDKRTVESLEKTIANQKPFPQEQEFIEKSAQLLAVEGRLRAADTNPRNHRYYRALKRIVGEKNADAILGLSGNGEIPKIPQESWNKLFIRLRVEKRSSKTEKTPESITKFLRDSIMGDVAQASNGPVSDDTESFGRFIDDQEGHGLQASPLPPRIRTDSPEWKAMSKEERKATLAGLQASPLPKTRDAEYLAAVKAGDMETAQRMVDDAARAANKKGPYVHGSAAESMQGAFRTGERDAGWFGAGAYLTLYESYAKRWGANVHRFFIPDGKYASIKAPNYNSITFEGDAELANLAAGGEDAFIENEALWSSKFSAVLQGMGYVGVNVELSGNPELEVVVFDPSQIKSADPVTYDEAGNVIPLSQRFNPTSDNILYASPLPETRKVIKINRELAENTRDLQRRFGKNIASGKLASFGNNRSRIEQDIVDAQYEHERTRKTNEDAMKVAKKRLEASRADVEEKLLKAAAGEDVSLDAADEMAFRYLINERSEQAGDDIEKHLENGKLRMALRLQRADLARRMQIGYDRLMTPAERTIEAFSAAIYTPSGKVERYAEKLPASKRQEFMETTMRERLEKVEKVLAKLGVTLGQVTGKKRDLQLANSKLDREIKRLRNIIDQGVIKMVQQGLSLADIKHRWKVDGEQAKEILTKAREEARVKLRAMYQSGMTPDQIRAALKDGLKSANLPASNSLTPDEIERLIEEHLVKDLGYIAPESIPAQPITRTPRKKVEKAAESNPLTSDWSRPIFKKGMDEFEFDREDREGIMQRVEVIRGLAGALGKIDGLDGETKAKAMAKLDEINAILKKYGTDAAGIFEAAQGIEDYGFDINDVAQVAAVSRAISMIDADIVDKASEWLYFSMLSGLQTMMVNATAAVPAAWESTVGRGFETAINLFFKDPMSAQLGESKYIIKAIRPALTRAWSNAQTAFAAQHPMFDRDVLAQEIDWERVMGGKGYRTGGSFSGKWGDRIRIPMRILTATDDFNTTLMACVEVGTFAYRIAKAKGMADGSAEMNKFIEDEVNKPGSFSYLLATEKAKSAIFSNPLPGQHDPVSGKKVPVNDLGDAVGYLAGKITDTLAKEHDNLFVKTTFAAMRIAFFPFQRTPFNILRKGVRYTLNPFSLFDIWLGLVQNSRTADGKWEWNAKGRNPELIRRMAMQMQGAVLMLLVAGLAEGDDDDQDKPLVITGSAPFSPRGQAEREAGARSGLGPYRISFRRKDGSERFGFSYGRLEPLATTLAASVDIMKSIKRTLRGGGDASDAASAAMGGFVAQAQDKSFLRGVGDFTELVTNALAEPDLKDNRKMQQFLAGRVAMVMPNIIRQPIRESDSNFRERSAGFMQELLYQTVPTGQKPAKVDPYGQPVTKPGTALGRTIDVMDSGTNTVHPMDRMLLKFRDKHPDKAWFPSVVNSAEFTNRKTGKSEKMNPEQLAEFKRMAGLRLDAALKTARLNLNNPTERDIESAKELVQKSRSDAKKLLSFKYSR